MPDLEALPGATPSVVVFAFRERGGARALLREAFPRRLGHVTFARSAAEFESAFRESLVDAAVVDLGVTQGSLPDAAWSAAALSREFPSVPFFGVTSLRAVDGPVLARCASYEFADVLVEGVDDAVVHELVLRHTFTARFAQTLQEPPEALSLSTPLQQRAWQLVVAMAGRPVRTAAIAQALRVTREHLSRSFAAEGAPNLKRVIDLVRLIAAAELAKNPGYDLRDVSRVLGFASASHLSTTAQRVLGTKSASLARLRTVDLVERFVRGHGRSRGQYGAQ